MTLFVGLALALVAGRTSPPALTTALAQVQRVDAAVIDPTIATAPWPSSGSCSCSRSPFAADGV